MNEEIIEIEKEEKRYLIALGMITYGGSFMVALGHALMKADMYNQAKIMTIWPDDCKKYIEYGRDAFKRGKRY